MEVKVAKAVVIHKFPNGQWYATLNDVPLTSHRCMALIVEGATYTFVRHPEGKES